MKTLFDYYLGPEKPHPCSERTRLVLSHAHMALVMQDRIGVRCATDTPAYGRVRDDHMRSASLHNWAIAMRGGLVL